MERPIVDIGKYCDDNAADYNPEQLCNHCRVKLQQLLFNSHGGKLRDKAVFEFGDCLFQIECIR